MTIAAMKRALEAILKFRNEPMLERLVKLRATDGYVALDLAFDPLRAAIAEQEKCEPHFKDVDVEWLYSVLRHADKNPDYFPDVQEGKYTLDGDSATVIAGLFAHPVPVPAGWQLVPVEPTPEMLREGMCYGLTSETYKAMLAAAPKPGENHD